jgi:hypothetical protein
MLNSQGGLRRSVAADLQQLAAITSRHSLRSSPFAAQLAANHTPVALSPFAHELLMRFLHNGGTRMLPLLSIINSHMDLQASATGGREGGGEARGPSEADWFSVPLSIQNQKGSGWRGLAARNSGPVRPQLRRTGAVDAATETHLCTDRGGRTWVAFRWGVSCDAESQLGAHAAMR